MKKEIVSKDDKDKKIKVKKSTYSKKKKLKKIF